MHHPMEASQIAHSDSEPLKDLLTPLLVAPGSVDLVLTGHNHVYERRKIRDGVQHITIGNGGALSHGTFEEDPNRVVGFNEESCFGWMEFSAGEIHFRAVSGIGGGVDDVILRRTNDATRLVAIDMRSRPSSE